jgi:hypothetical protein
MLKSIRLTNHTDCRAEPHMFGLHWIDLAPLANLTSLSSRRSRRCRRFLAESHRHQDAQESSSWMREKQRHALIAVLGENSKDLGNAYSTLPSRGTQAGGNCITDSILDCHP